MAMQKVQIIPESSFYAAAVRLGAFVLRRDEAERLLAAQARVRPDKALCGSKRDLYLAP